MIKKLKLHSRVEVVKMLRCQVFEVVKMLRCHVDESLMKCFMNNYCYDELMMSMLFVIDDVYVVKCN
jgi:hypothetical protein